MWLISEFDNFSLVQVPGYVDISSFVDKRQMEVLNHDDGTTPESFLAGTNQVLYVCFA